MRNRQDQDCNKPLLHTFSHLFTLCMIIYIYFFNFTKLALLPNCWPVVYAVVNLNEVEVYLGLLLVGYRI